MWGYSLPTAHPRPPEVTGWCLKIPEGQSSSSRQPPTLHHKPVPQQCPPAILDWPLLPERGGTVMLGNPYPSSGKLSLEGAMEKRKPTSLYSTDRTRGTPEGASEPEVTQQARAGQARRPTQGCLAGHWPQTPTSPDARPVLLLLGSGSWQPDLCSLESSIPAPLISSNL